MTRARTLTSYWYGRVAITTEFSEREIDIDVLNPGQYFGELALLTKKPRVRLALRVVSWPISFRHLTSRHARQGTADLVFHHNLYRTWAHVSCTYSRFSRRPVGWCLLLRLLRFTRKANCNAHLYVVLASQMIRIFAIDHTLPYCPPSQTALFAPNLNTLFGRHLRYMHLVNNFSL